MDTISTCLTEKDYCFIWLSQDLWIAGYASSIQLWTPIAGIRRAYTRNARSQPEADGFHKMLKVVYEAYALLFARRIFVRWNMGLYRLALRGLGILNYRTSRLSGEQTFLRRYITGLDNCTVVDVGANVGRFSEEILRHNRNANIYAFEPHPITYHQLAAKFSGVDNVKVYNVAMGSSGAQLTLYDYEDQDGSSHASTIASVIEDIHHGRSVSHAVDVTTLDSFATENKIESIDLLKIDTEGNELEVLKGGKKLISENRVHAIQFEFNEMNVLSRSFFKDFWELLPDYEFNRLLPNGSLRIEQYDPKSCEIFAYQNLVAVRRGFIESGKPVRDS